MGAMMHPAAQEPEPRPTYREHMTVTGTSNYSNYYIHCSCGWSCDVASLSDVFAAESALKHVREHQPHVFRGEPGGWCLDCTRHYTEPIHITQEDQQQ